MEEWREITGQQLLERYGKTELGMVLSDPIEVEARKSGFVGNPMPGVQVRVVKPGSAGEPGNILLMGDNDGTTILQVGNCLAEISIGTSFQNQKFASIKLSH